MEEEDGWEEEYDRVGVFFGVVGPCWEAWVGVTLTAVGRFWRVFITSVVLANSSGVFCILNSILWILIAPQGGRSGSGFLFARALSDFAPIFGYQGLLGIRGVHR